MDQAHWCQSVWMRSVICCLVLGVTGCVDFDESTPESAASPEISSVASALSKHGLSPKEKLGKKLFFDKRLSFPEGQACAACHDPAVGTTGGDYQVNLFTVVYPGAVHERYGNRKPPSAAYASFSPPFTYDGAQGYQGGQFWDGRASTLVDQAKGPFLNPLEQNNPNMSAVVDKVKAGKYAKLFRQVYGAQAFNDIPLAYHYIAEAIAAYESSGEINSFSSKYDHYLAKKVQLSDNEAKGLALFNGKAKCANCHPSTPTGNTPPLFTDFTYDNLGLPKNPSNPFYFMPPQFNPDGTKYVDRGLGDFIKNPANDGKFKVPTLRNVDKRPDPYLVKAYGHNGVFKSLKEIIHFYNTRDIAGLWPPPEVATTVNTTELGNLQLTSEEEDQLVAFLQTLSDS